MCREQSAPKLESVEQVIVRDVPALVTKLQGWRYGTVATVALFTGLRLGEALALRWSNVDLDRKVLRVVATLEETKTFGIRFKPPKTKAGKREVTLPDILVEALREHRKAQTAAAWHRQATRRCAAVCAYQWRAAVDRQHLISVGEVRQQCRHGRDYVPRAAAHAREPVDRCRCGCCDRFKAPRPRHARHHAERVHAYVQAGRWQGGGGDQCGDEMVAIG
jgi:integrase